MHFKSEIISTPDKTYKFNFNRLKFNAMNIPFFYSIFAHWKSNHIIKKNI